MNPQRILVVDDDRCIASLISLHIGMIGCEAVIALRGDEALMHASRNEFVLIMLDLMLPHTNGFEVCRALRERDTTKKTPVIILSALSDEGSRARAFDAGANEYMTKPFSPAELRAKSLQLIGSL